MLPARTFSHCSNGIRLVAGVVGQLLVAGAAVVGVISVAGCANPQLQALQQQQLLQQQATMRSQIAAPPQRTLVEEPQQLQASPAQPQLPPRAAPRQTLDPVASARERKISRQNEVENMVAEATMPAQQPAPVTRGSAALRVAEKTVGPLADTLAAIDAAQRVVVENLRNTELPGYKASRSACVDGRDIARQLDVSQGELQATQRSFDVAVQGEGFFQIQVYVENRPDSVVGFTRNGHFFVSKDGHLVLGQVDGYKLVPPIQVPVGTTELRIEGDGTVRATQAGADKPALQPLGRLTLARFTDPSALQPLGAGIYAETEGSGAAVESSAGERGAGSIMQGYIEASNVDLIRERLRLRFLQSWRNTILAAMDGEVTVSPAVAAPISPTPTPAVTPPPPSVQVNEPTNSGRPMIRSISPGNK